MLDWHYMQKVHSIFAALRRL